MVFFVKRTKGHDPKNEANFLDTPLNFHGFTKKNPQLGKSQLTTLMYP